MNKQTSMAIATALLLLAACQSAEEFPPADNDSRITLGTISVAGQTTTRADNDGSDCWYPGDQLSVSDIGNYTRTPHGIWSSSDAILVKEITNPNALYATTKGSSDAVLDQSDWQAYHNADYISGNLQLDGSQLITPADAPLNHLHPDVVITIKADDSNGAWGEGEFAHHIRTAQITVHGTVGNTPSSFTPWLASVTDEAATLRLIMPEGSIPSNGETLITITPADDSNPIIGKMGTLSTPTQGAQNERITVTFSNYRNQRSLGIGKTLVIPWTDGGSEELTYMEWDGYDFIITNEKDLQAFRDAVNGGKVTATALQVCNITLTEKSWTPIGSKSGFQGLYNGGGHYISGLTIDETTSGDKGLFCNTNNATISGITIKNPTIKGDGFIGALVGTTSGDTHISNCHVLGGTVTGTGNNVGGLVGYNSDGIITACHSSATVKGTVIVGGLVSDNGNRSTIQFCYATGAVQNTGIGNIYAGGLAGHNSKIINSCYATGNVTIPNTSNYTRVGSLAGNNSGSISYSDASGAAPNNKLIGPGTGSNNGTYGNTIDLTILRGYTEGVTVRIPSRDRSTKTVTIYSTIWQDDLTLDWEAGQVAP
ncbi:hypothetical protein LJC35_04920 [Parabacteroides sp. OttesenSCG-928-N08]|nr:hypothetical protein [Parabacteroides sp. OttesenSCG-928-N08]